MVSSPELERLLSESIEAATHRADHAFEALAKGRPLVLMGAGGLGQRTVAGLATVGVRPVALTDNNAARHGTFIDGIPVLAPAEAARLHGTSAAFVVTIWGANSPHRFATSRTQLTALGCDVVIPFPLLYWKYPAALLPHYLVDRPEHVLEQRDDVRRAFALWHDDASRAEFLAQLRLRLHADFDGLPSPVAHPQYFADDLFTWSAEEYVVDGGAFDGDSIRMMQTLHGGAYGHILALEPDPLNFEALQRTVAALPESKRARIDVKPLALGSSAGTLPMQATGNASSVMGAGATGNIVDVEVVRFDDIIGAARPTFFKLDIEGAEPDAMLGARESIIRHGPVCAICVYHRQDHLWRLPLMLHAWRSDYRFTLRPHNEEGWDLVCYAVPPSRLIGS